MEAPYYPLFFSPPLRGAIPRVRVRSFSARLLWRRRIALCLAVLSRWHRLGQASASGGGLAGLHPLQPGAARRYWYCQQCSPKSHPHNSGRIYCMFIKTHDTTQTTQSGHCLDQANILTVLDHHTRWQSSSPRDPGTAGPGCVWASQQPRPPRLRVPYLWLLGLKSWFSTPQKSARTTNGKGLYRGRHPPVLRRHSPYELQIATLSRRIVMNESSELLESFCCCRCHARAA